MQVKTAFRWHLQNPATMASPYGDVAKIEARTARALHCARADVAAGRDRYPAPVKADPATCMQSDGTTYVKNPEACGLRLVGRVQCEPDYWRDRIWDTRGNSGWYTDPHGDVFKDGSGLCWGEVYQLPGTEGHARFVAGYRFGGCDGGPTLDLRNVFAEYVKGDGSAVTDLPGARQAAYAADSMAKAAAEAEREYQTAWAAGCRWSNLKSEVQDCRREALRLLREFKAARGAADRFSFPTLCAAIREKIRDQLDAIQTARATMAELAEGQHESLYFWTGEKRLQEAFNEGAGAEVLA